MIYVLGEAMLELTADADGQPQTAVAGDTFNTAVALAQLGIEVQYLTGLGSDADSGKIITTCQRWAVSTDLIAVVADLTAGRYTIHLDPHGERSFTYDRDSSAARALFCDPQLLARQLEKITPGQWIYLSGITLAIASPQCRELLTDFLQRYRATQGQVAFDCNHRPLLWQSPSLAQKAYTGVLQHCDLFFAGSEDISTAWGIEAEAVPDKVTALQQPLTVLKRGGDSILLYTHGAVKEVPVQPVAKIVDSTGAGDIFNAGFLAAHLQGQSLIEACMLGQRLAAECLQHRGALLPAPCWQRYQCMNTYAAAPKSKPIGSA